MKTTKDQICAQDAEVEKYREKIMAVVNSINEIRFLNQIYTILKRHMEKRGD